MSVDSSQLSAVQPTMSEQSLVLPVHTAELVHVSETVQ